MSSKIIGFTGVANCGKDTASEAIMEKNSSVEMLSFAKPLKDAVKILFNFTNEQLYDQDLKEVVDERYGKSPREILQWLGTDIIRKQFSEDFFVNRMKENIEKNECNMIVINDVRFDNEAELIKSMEGKNIKIERPIEKKHTHSSENGIKPELIDAIIHNNGTREEFKNTVNMTVNYVSKW